MSLTWRDTDEIGWTLADRYPEIDPLKLSFTKLHQMIVSLPEFKDDPAGSSEGVLERIQMTWLDEKR